MPWRPAAPSRARSSRTRRVVIHPNASAHGCNNDLRGTLPHGPALDWAAWGGRTRPRRSSCARFGSARPTACSTCTRWIAAASARSPRECARRSRASARGSSRSRTWSFCCTRARASSRRSPASPRSSLAPRAARGLVSARGRTRRRRGDAAALHRAGGERPRVQALTRFLDAARCDPPDLTGAPALDPLASRSSSSCFGSRATSRTSRAAWSAAPREGSWAIFRRGGAVCRDCEPSGRFPFARGLPRHPRASRDARSATRPQAGERAVPARRSVVMASYEFHGGFRLRTLRREARSRQAVTSSTTNRAGSTAGGSSVICSEESYWAQGRSREVLDGLDRDAPRVVGLYHEGQQVGFRRGRSPTVTLVLSRGRLRAR